MLERNDGQFKDDILKCILMNKNQVLIQISQTFVHEGQIDKNTILVTLMS